MIVSGRNVYDAFGRVAKAYYPVTEALGSKTAFNKAFDNVSPTVTVYDVLDHCPCLCCLWRVVITAKAFAIDIVGIVLTVVWQIECLVIVLDGLQLLIVLILVIDG